MAKCPYCDFNSHVSAKIDQTLWLDAYLSELDRVALETKGRVLRTVFFGGGTPSLMDPEIVAAIIAKIRLLWPTANDLEVTLEANPTSIEAGRFRGYRDGGVNRISMGAQALNDDDLRKLGRMHTVAEARKAFDIARSTFDRVNFDLIYARQDQTLDQWRAELGEALNMAVDHLSLYQLTIEEGTAFGDRYARGKLRGLPEDDLSADMYAMTQEMCDRAGFSGYEVSNHAKLGEESRHNLIYWHYGDYAGIGPGAHGRVTIEGTRYATESIRAPGAWLKAVNARDSGEALREPILRLDQANEFLLMGLRLKEGINIDRYENLSGKPLNPNKINALVELNMINVDGRILSTTQTGRVLLNAVLRELIPD